MRESKTISLPAAHLEALRQEAIEKGVSVAAIMTFVVEAFLENAGQGQTQSPSQWTACCGRRSP